MPIKKQDKEISNMVRNIISAIEEKHNIKFNPDSIVNVITDEMQNYNRIYVPKNCEYNLVLIDNVYYITGLTNDTDWLPEVLKLIIKERTYLAEPIRSKNRIFLDLLLKNGFYCRYYEISALKTIFNYYICDVTGTIENVHKLQFDKYFKYRIKKLENIIPRDKTEEYIKRLKTL